MKPFHPIVIRSAHGARHPVKHPDYLVALPVGDSILIVDFDLSLICV